jgi:hypothetical protein
MGTRYRQSESSLESVAQALLARGKPTPVALPRRAGPTGPLIWRPLWDDEELSDPALTERCSSTERKPLAEDLSRLKPSERNERTNDHPPLR